MTTDEVYASLLSDAWESQRLQVRSHWVRRLGFVQCTFVSTPLVCLRRTAWRHALQEFQWFLSGSTRVDDLPEGVRLWWAPWGDGAGYGRFADRLNAGGAFTVYCPSGPLPPCSYTGWSEVAEDDGLRCTMYQRSCDLVCGAPHDWFQLWAYATWRASRLGVQLHSARWVCVDAHVYEAHAEVVRETLRQRPQPSPELAYSPTSTDFLAKDFYLDRPYTPAVTLKAELLV